LISWENDGSRPETTWLPALQPGTDKVEEFEIDTDTSSASLTGWWWSPQPAESRWCCAD
jgi:hypothetical protein